MVPRVRNGSTGVFKCCLYCTMWSTCGIIYASEHGTESLEFSPNQLCTNDYGL
uniref:Uncharacterized protein n=1 Tax=Magallana gigas TaxID=29159 RepID=K1PV80_MAGGI